MRFLVDESVSPCLKFVLGAWGHDADAVGLRADLQGESDTTILATAAAERRVVVTFDTEDYERLHSELLAAGRHHAGILVCRQQEGYRNFGRLLRWMRNLLGTMAEGDFQGKVYHLHTFT